MPFASRNEDGVWRLCLRKGKTFGHLCQKWWPGVEVRFSSQVKAKACADELNEKCWKAYEASEPDRRRNRQPRPYWEMIDIIYSHEGLSDTDYRRINEEPSAA